MMVNCVIDGKPKSYFMEKWLYEVLENQVKPAVTLKDFDYLFCVTGEEGTGKSVLALQIAKFLDPAFGITNICYTPDQFAEAITNSKPHQCIVFDEAFTGLSSRASMSAVNQLMVGLMMEMRQKNLFVIIVMPSFFMLERYVALHRAKCLFNTYLDHGKRGQYAFFDRKNMKLMYLRGKKSYTWGGVRPPKMGKFFNFYTVNEEEYRKKKRDAIGLKSLEENPSNKFHDQRNRIIRWLLDKYKMEKQELSDWLKEEAGVVISRSMISKIYTKTDGVQRKRDFLT